MHFSYLVLSSLALSFASAASTVTKTVTATVTATVQAATCTGTAKPGIITQGFGIDPFSGATAGFVPVKQTTATGKNAHSGNSYINLAFPSGSNVYTFVTNVALAASTTYTFSAWAKIANASENCLMYLQGNPNNAFNQQCKVTGAYSLCTYTFNSGSGSSAVTGIGIETECLDLYKTMNFYLDDVSLL